MERDLTVYDVTLYKKISQSCNAKEIRCVRIDDEKIILKSLRKQKYFYEKGIYFLLKNEDFLPKLKYFDDEHCILGITDVGMSLSLYRKNDRKEFVKQRDNFDAQLRTICDTLYDKYGLYHNDLRYKNICVDANNTVRLIDFEYCKNKLRFNPLLFYETKYFKWNRLC